LLEGQAQAEIETILLQAFDSPHEEIYKNYNLVQNTGYLIDSQLFYPGDSFHDPEIPIDILALPVAGPWCRIADAVRYALKLKPRVVFPVHDGVLHSGRIGSNHKVPEKILPEHNIAFVPMTDGSSHEF